MSESIVMKELRKIREENSLRHISQTREENLAEFAASAKWFEGEMKRLREEKAKAEENAVI